MVTKTISQLITLFPLTRKGLNAFLLHFAIVLSDDLIIFHVVSYVHKDHIRLLDTFGEVWE